MNELAAALALSLSLSGGAWAWAWLGRRAAAARLARACHEIRNPLFAAQLALEGVPGARSGAAVLEIGRAVAALAALERTPVAPERAPAADVARLAREAAAGWEVLARRHGAELSVTLPSGSLAARAHAARVCQALGNLVANAAEHGGGRVRVAITDGAGWVRVEVADDGPGLPAPVGILLAGARRRRARRGHGLAVVEAVAAECGGRLSCAPAARGARLVLELPAVPAADRRPAGERAA